jgi:RNA polymerase sigma-70 factor (ECF subfamily)
VYNGRVEGRPPDDVALVERARAGDERAFEMLLDQHATIAFRLALHLTGSAPDAEDAVQEAVAKAFRALPRFRRGSPFRPWLLTIVANEARNRRRSARRREAVAFRVATEDRPGGAAPSPEATALDRERRTELLRALELLGRRDREVIACRYLLGLSEEEAAAALGVRRGTVKSRTARALDRMRRQLEDPR